MLTVYNLMFTRLADYECSENIKLYQHHAFCPKKVTLFRDINGMNINIGIRVLRKRHIIRIVGCSHVQERRMHLSRSSLRILAHPYFGRNTATRRRSCKASDRTYILEGTRW